MCVNDNWNLTARRSIDIALIQVLCVPRPQDDFNVKTTAYLPDPANIGGKTGWRVEAKMWDD